MQRTCNQADAQQKQEMCNGPQGRACLRQAAEHLACSVRSTESIQTWIDVDSANLQHTPKQQGWPGVAACRIHTLLWLQGAIVHESCIAADSGDATTVMQRGKLAAPPKRKGTTDCESHCYRCNVDSWLIYCATAAAAAPGIRLSLLLQVSQAQRERLALPAHLAPKVPPAPQEQTALLETSECRSDQTRTQHE
jgi:hypothetical protein